MNHVRPASVGATSEVYLVRSGIEQEIGKTWQHLIRVSTRDGQPLLGKVLLHGHRVSMSCQDRNHWVVSATGLAPVSVPTTETDEHTEDVHLLKLTLRDARAEIVRLRTERSALLQQAASRNGTGTPSVATEEPLGPETPEETVEVNELDRKLREGYTPARSVYPVRLVKTKLLAPSAKLPSRVHHGDAGFDLYVSRTAKIEPGAFTDVHCDVAVQLPDNVWGLIVGRSSTIRNRGLLVTPGVIDSGWRGELFAGVWNLNSHAVEVAAGDRLAQLIPMPLLSDRLGLVQWDKLDEHDRGTNGFGSTGQ